MGFASQYMAFRSPALPSAQRRALSHTSTVTAHIARAAAQIHRAVHRKWPTSLLTPPRFWDPALLADLEVEAGFWASAVLHLELQRAAST